MKFLIYVALTYGLAWMLTTVIDQIQHYNIPTKHWYEFGYLLSIIVFTHIIAYFVRK
jgi:uncharacterized membrane protein YhdT